MSQIPTLKRIPIMKKIILFFACFYPFHSMAFQAQELFDQLRERNHMVWEERTRLQAVQHNVGTTWTAPELAISEMNTNTPFFDNKMKMARSVELSQMFPNPWRLSAGDKFKQNNERFQSEQIEVTFKKVKKEAYDLFLELYKNIEERNLNQAKKNYLEKFLSRLQSAQVQGQEERLQIVDVQNDLAELKITLEQNLAEKERMERMLNQMMGRELTTPIGKPELMSMNLAEKTSLPNVELKNLDARIAMMESEISMKNSEFFPELSLKGKINKSYSDKIDDSKELMIGITLPFFFFNQQSNEVQSMRYQTEAMKHSRTNMETEIEMKRANLKSEILDLDKSISFLRTNVLPVREKRLNLLTHYSFVDMGTLMNFKMSIDDYYMSRMKLLEKEIEQQKKYFDWTELYI